MGPFMEIWNNFSDLEHLLCLETHPSNCCAQNDQRRLSQDNTHLLYFNLNPNSSPSPPFHILARTIFHSCNHRIFKTGLKSIFSTYLILVCPTVIFLAVSMSENMHLNASVMPLQESKEAFEIQTTSVAFFDVKLA